jgi:O-antigen ligase
VVSSGSTTFISFENRLDACATPAAERAPERYDAFMAEHKMTDRNRRMLSDRMGAALFYGTFGALMFGPIAFGAVETWSIFVLEMLSVLLMLLWFSKQWLDGQLTLRWNPLFAPMAGFGILVIAQLALHRSAYPHDTVSDALLYGAYAMLCFLASQTLLRSSQARKLAVIFCVYGFVIAAMALFQGIAPNGKLLWLRHPEHGGWIYGSYVNHNHYAGLMELLVPIPLILSLTRLVEQKERIVAGVAAAVMTGTIFLSGSRGGMLAIFVEFAVLAVVLLRQNRGMRIALGVAAFAIVLLSLLSWLGGKELTTRVSSISTEARSEVSGGMRLTIDRDSLHMFQSRPVLGWGLGTFPVVYPEFRSFYTNFFVNEAHNDYLQLLTEMGLLGVGVMVWFLIVLYRNAIRKIGDWTSDVSSAVTLACTLGFTGILVHSLLDFNLQIPANAALFYVFCTIAAAPPLLQRVHKRKPVPSEAPEELPASEVV